MTDFLRYQRISTSLDQIQRKQIGHHTRGDTECYQRFVTILRKTNTMVTRILDASLNIYMRAVVWCKSPLNLNRRYLCATRAPIPATDMLILLHQLKKRSQPVFDFEKERK